MYPGQGLLAHVVAGGRFARNRFLPGADPDHGRRPGQLKLQQVSMISQPANGCRCPTAVMPPSSPALDLAAATGDFAESRSTVEFEDQLRLRGYVYSPAPRTAGETVNLTLIGRRAPVPTLITLSSPRSWTKIRRAGPTRIRSPNQAPAPGCPDEVQTARLHADLDANTPPGLYPLIVGVYTQTDGGRFERLQIRARKTAV